MFEYPCKNRFCPLWRSILQFFAKKIDAAHAVGDFDHERCLQKICLDVARHIQGYREENRGDSKY